jgi:hypothetical protein
MPVEAGAVWGGFIAPRGGRICTHYLEERNHQGKRNVLLFPPNEERIGSGKGLVRCKERLGGLLKYYHREAA